VIAQRILAVAAAFFLVASVALATLTPPDMPLGQAVFLLDHDVLRATERTADAYHGHWLWSYVCVPLLVRPTWLLTMTLAILCAGLSMTLGSRQAKRNSHRRRS